MPICQVWAAAANVIPNWLTEPSFQHREFLLQGIGSSAAGAHRCVKMSSDRNLPDRFRLDFPSFGIGSPDFCASWVISPPFQVALWHPMALSGDFRVLRQYETPTGPDLFRNYRRLAAWVATQDSGHASVHRIIIRCSSEASSRCGIVTIYGERIVNRSPTALDTSVWGVSRHFRDRAHVLTDGSQRRRLSPFGLRSLTQVLPEVA